MTATSAESKKSASSSGAHISSLPIRNPAAKRAPRRAARNEQREEDHAADSGRVARAAPGRRDVALGHGTDTLTGRPVEVGEEVERARHEDARAQLVRPPHCGDGFLHGHDVRNVSTRPVGELRAGSARAFDDCVATSDRPTRASRSSIASTSLSRSIEQTTIQSCVGQALEEPVDGLGRVRAVPELVRGAPLEPARRAGRRRRPRSAGRGMPPPPRCAPPNAYLVLGEEVRPLGLAEHRRSHRATTTASFSRAIASRVSPSTSVCSSATFVSWTTGASRTFVASSLPPRPASTTATSTPCGGELRQRGRRQRLELRRTDAARPRAGSDRRRARTPSSSVSSRSAPARDVRRRVAPTRSLSVASSAAIVRVAVDLPFVPTTWIDGKRTLRVTELRRAARASGRGRTPPATARATAIQAVCGPIAGNVDGSRTRAYRSGVVERRRWAMRQPVFTTFTRAAAGLDR